MTLKEIKQYADLYGYNTTTLLLKQKYSFVSFAKKSIPTAGSMTKCSSLLLYNDYTSINKVILHKNNRVTLKTNLGFLQFFN